MLVISLWHWKVKYWLPIEFVLTIRFFISMVKYMYVSSMTILWVGKVAAGPAVHSYSVTFQIDLIWNIPVTAKHYLWDYIYLSQALLPSYIPQARVHDDKIRCRLLTKIFQDCLEVRRVALRHEVEADQMIGFLVLANFTVVLIVVKNSTFD